MHKKVLVGEMEDLKSKHTNLNDNLSDIQASLSSLNAAVAQLGSGFRD
jgi:prefoldin subunit 5